MRAKKSIPPASSALAAASPAHCGDAGSRPEMPMALIPANMIAAVAESAPTTRWRDDPNSAKAMTGMSIVYRPVITGIPAMRV
jgi:hypothetical protein